MNHKYTLDWHPQLSMLFRCVCVSALCVGTTTNETFWWSCNDASSTSSLARSCGKSCPTGNPSTVWSEIVPAFSKVGTAANTISSADTLWLHLSPQYRKPRHSGKKFKNHRPMPEKYRCKVGLVFSFTQYYNIGPTPFEFIPKYIYIYHVFELAVMNFIAVFYLVHHSTTVTVHIV